LHVITVEKRPSRRVADRDSGVEHASHVRLVFALLMRTVDQEGVVFAQGMLPAELASTLEGYVEFGFIRLGLAELGQCADPVSETALSWLKVKLAVAFLITMSALVFTGCMLALLLAEVAHEQHMATESLELCPVVLKPGQIHDAADMSR